MSGRDDVELADLLRAALSGNDKAYAEFLGRAAGMVRGFARRRIRAGLDAEDIVQETLLAIHTKRHTWRPDAPVTPWIVAIARHKLVDAFRRRGQRVDVDIDVVAETLPQPEVEAASERDVGRALAALPDGQRSVVASISVDGMSIRETAAKFGMSEGAVRVALHRGLAAIARTFGRE